MTRKSFSSLRRAVSTTRPQKSYARSPMEVKSDIGSGERLPESPPVEETIIGGEHLPVVVQIVALARRSTRSRALSHRGCRAMRSRASRPRPRSRCRSRAVRKVGGRPVHFVLPDTGPAHGVRIPPAGIAVAAVARRRCRRTGASRPGSPDCSRGSRISAPRSGSGLRLARAGGCGNIRGFRRSGWISFWSEYMISEGWLRWSRTMVRIFSSIYRSAKVPASPAGPRDVDGSFRRKGVEAEFRDRARSGLRRAPCSGGGRGGPGRRRPRPCRRSCGTGCSSFRRFSRRALRARRARGSARGRYVPRSPRRWRRGAVSAGRSAGGWRSRPMPEAVNQRKPKVRSRVSTGCFRPDRTSVPRSA